jgi:type IV secretory pathway VirB2 component (pilin)
MEADHVLRIRYFLILCIILAILLPLTAQTVTSASQLTEELQPQFGRAFVLARRAEAAGATREEVAGLVLLLNKALQLDEEATRLPTSDAQRVALLAQVNETLGRAETEATGLEVTASQRTFTNKIVAYVTGGIAALLATIAYACGGHIWRRYRIKRTFQMRIFPKVK